MKPTKPLLSPNYTISYKTDIRKTFRRIERERKALEEAQRIADEEANKKTIPLKRAAK